MKKRILVVGQHFWPEQFRVNDIVDFMLDEGYEVDVLCGLPNYPSGQLAPGYTLWNRRKENYNGATVYRSFEIPRGNNSNLRILLNYVSFPLTSLFHIPRLLFRKYDSIFLYQLSPVMMTLSGIFLSKLKRIPSTMYVLDLWPENLFSVLDVQNPFLRGVATKVSHWHYRRVDKIVALSTRMRSRLSEITEKPEAEIIVVPQAAEKIYESDVSDPELEVKFRGKFNVMFTGNISPAQSFGTIIEAAEILRDSGIEDLRWIIVGDGMSREAVEGEIAQKGLSEYFSFEGFHPVERMPAFIREASVLVGCLVSSDLLEATVPAKVMSYIASGKPIVLAMDGEVQQLINHEIRCGFVSDTEDAVALASNVLRVYRMTDPERDDLGKRARKYHDAHFERNKVLKGLVDFVAE